tara:strand:+ start:342 stop:671 length:330 start_codon:yes stop_codon:yes gene_type:complete
MSNEKLINFNEEINLNIYNCPLFRVSWNGDEIIEIHSKETLIKSYGISNLFDDDIEWLGYPKNIFITNNIIDKREFKTLDEVINFLNDDDLKSLSIKFISDNCEITRIK